MATTEPSPGERRLHLIEIAVLADDRELQHLCDQLPAALTLPDPNGRQTGARASITAYDGADLPRRVQAELLEEIACQSPDPRPPSVSPTDA